jgi:hypothetical protein
MATTLDAVRELLTLTENVRGLRDDVIRMATDMRDLRERLVRLEVREEVVIEKTRNAAVMAVHQMSGDLLERVIALELVHGPNPTTVKQSATPKLMSAD